jgi:hypothetical protein
MVLTLHFRHALVDEPKFELIEFHLQMGGRVRAKVALQVLPQEDGGVGKSE